MLSLQAARSLASTVRWWAPQVGGAASCSLGSFSDTSVLSISPYSSRGSSSSSKDADVHSTTVLCVRKDGQVVLVADGQVTMGGTVIKPNVRKTRKIGEHVVGGFAGATADAFTLFERLESKIEEHSGQLTRAAVELCKMWRMDKYLRRLDAALVVADRHQSLQITGNGDVLEPHDGIIAIGSGSPYALAAARALIDQPNMDALAIARKAMRIASEACIYTNDNYTALHIDAEGKISEVDLKESEAAAAGAAATPSAAAGSPQVAG